jgi:hypothetical protein
VRKAENYTVTMSVEALQQRIDGLTLERQALRAQGASRERLEQNRIELVEAQWSLSHALIKRYYPAAA